MFNLPCHVVNGGVSKATIGKSGSWSTSWKYPASLNNTFDGCCVFFVFLLQHTKLRRDTTDFKTAK